MYIYQFRYMYCLCIQSNVWETNFEVSIGKVKPHNDGLFLGWPDLFNIEIKSLSPSTRLKKRNKRS